MVRPRLVEEGKPLGDWISSDVDNRSNNGDIMETEMDYYVPIVASRSTATTGLQSASTSDAAPPSSLLRALGGELPTSVGRKTAKRSMRFEIGGRTFPASATTVPTTMDRDQMEYETHASSMAGSNPSLSDNAITSSRSAHQGYPIEHHGIPQHLHDNPPASCAHRRPYSTTSVTRTHVEIGADYRHTERMVGVEDHSVPLPLVVVDGANVAYAYAHAREEHFHSSGKVEPDMRGLHVTCSYFSSVRVRIVLPASFVRSKPRVTDNSNLNAHMETDQFDILHQLQRHGKLVAAPPRDDDDAYCLTIAQRENLRALQSRQGLGPAFVLSNDMFRDAQVRDTTGNLTEWLENGDRPDTGPGRISYTFVDLDRKDTYGDPIFDLVPNPRHPLIIWIENMRRQQGSV